MHRPTTTRQSAGLLAALALLAAPPAVAQDGLTDVFSPAPVCRAGDDEFQPRVDLTAPALSAEQRDRGRNVVVLNGRGYNYASGVQTPSAARPLRTPAPVAPGPASNPHP